MSLSLPYKCHMKTIAVILDDTTVQVLDELATTVPQPCSRSALVRTAIREFVEREHQRNQETREDEILRTHGKRLAQQARALVKEQARP